jgi:tetratricopeptide (TPR) repeat protein/tRNA A-37 threonylcarbamoyl transferase component Bud32
MAAADRHLLFGMLALQTGMINQGQLVAAFQAWTLDKTQGLADILEARGDLNSAKRAALDALAAVHVETHGGDVEQSLAAVPSSRSTCDSLARLGEPEIGATLARVARSKNGHATEPDLDDAERTTTYSVGRATSDGQRFRILRPHARGGLGAVFVALDEELHREVALKQILEKHADDSASRQRFMAEAEITGGLEHPGVVPVYGLGTDADGRPYYAMRFIKGDSLKEAIDRFHKDKELRKDPGRRSVELRKMLHRFIDVCNAIDYAHSRGVIHRDLKPANIIVGRHGETLVVDWGLAKAVGRADPSAGEQTITPSSSGSSETLPGSALGTPAYMSPEQARGDLKGLGPRSDVYSLGATLYCLLAGRPPFENEDIGIILRRVEEGQFLRPSQHGPGLDDALEAVCLKAMATEPAGRYPTPKALADDLERWMADEPVTAWREPVMRRARRWARRNRTVVTAAGAAVLAALVGTAAVLAVQTRANADLRASNAELAVANAKVSLANSELGASNRRARARFKLAEEAIKMFHTGVSEDLLLKQKEFGTLRTKLLRGAQEFYRKLEGMLGGQADRDSRLALARAYFEVGELTKDLDSKKDALAIYQRALALFEDLARESPADAELRGEVERCYAAIALVLPTLGRTAEALAAAGRAREIAQDLAAADPADIRRRSELARADQLYGAFLRHNGRAGEGLEALERARAIQEELVRINPSDEQVRLELAKTCDDLAMYLDSSGHSDEALAVYGRACDLVEELCRRNPTNARIAHEVPRTLGNLAIALEDAGRENEALAAHDRARELLRVIGEANPSLLSVTRDRAWIDGMSAAILTRSGRDGEALPLLEGARKARETLLKAGSSSVRDQTQLIQIHGQIAAIHARAGRNSQALASREPAVAVATRLATAGLDDLGFQSELARAYLGIGDLLTTTGAPSEALPWYDKAVAIQRRLVEAELSGSQQNLASSLRLRGITLQKCGRAAEAVSAFREAINLLAGIASPTSGDIYDLACCQSLLSGVAPDAGSGLAAADGQADADQAILSLRRAFAAGWKRLDYMRADTDLDPICGRRDYQVLILDHVFPRNPFGPDR